MSRWIVATKKAEFREIGERFGFDQVTARLLRNREVVGDDAIRAWLYGDSSMLHDPSRMLGMDKAAGMIEAAVEAGKRIRIIGDYDVDGICATYILYRGLSALGSTEVDYVLPDRVRDGYGLNETLIRDAAADGIEVILTCDNGIRAIEEIRSARDLGIAVVVTDHHEPKVGSDGAEILPAADAVVDPAREGETYPYRSICGAVVAYKFLQVLFQRSGAAEEALLRELIVFAAFATNCDVMPLLDENRIIMREGLRQIGEEPNLGLAALVRACGLDPREVRASDFGFTLGPCLNATGRLDSARRAMELLTSMDEGQAARLAGDLIALNEERKGLTAEGVRRACEKVRTDGFAEDRVLVIWLPDCHESIAGIIAGRVRERYGRPTIIFTDAAEEGLIKGSGRSVPGYDLYRGLSAFEELFVKFGGHEQAAGLTMRRDNLEALRRGLNARCDLGREELEPVLYLDMEMPLSYASLDLVRQFSLLEPFGKGNPEPLFAAREVRLRKGQIVGKNHNVGKYQIADGAGRTYDMIYFDGLDRFHDFLREEYGADVLRRIYDGFMPCEDCIFHMAYNAQINSYRGRESLQFRMRDFKHLKR